MPIWRRHFRKREQGSHPCVTPHVSWLPLLFYPALPVAAADPGNFNVNLPVVGSAGNLALAVLGSGYRVDMELSALQVEGRGEVVSTPRVITANGKQAEIEQGREIPYQTSGGTSGTTTSFKKASLRLAVTPQITPDGNVILDVDVNKDSVGVETRSGFAIDTKHVKTQVLVENGGTVVLGGIFQQTQRTSDTKVPVLGDIPVVGNLFKSTGRTDDKTELLIFITPKIVAERKLER